MMLFLSVFFILLRLQDISAQGTYSVVAPKILRPNKDYTVVVSTHGTLDVVQFTIEVAGQQDVGRVLLSRQIAELIPDSSQTVKFEFGELSFGIYNLTVTGRGGLDFSNSTRLEYQGKSYSTFIQTDRGIYKPGDTIKFRAIVVNPFLKPSVTGAIDVYVSDGAGNRVKQWLRVFTTRGVFSGELPLSEEPVLGNWTITVDVLGQQTSAYVMVAEYVLPKFEVEVILPEYATFKDGQITATVQARYTYGRPVKGEVTLQVAPTYKYSYLQAPYDNPFSIVKIMRGKTDITLGLFYDLRLKKDYIRELEFTAYVKEELTGRVQNSTSYVTVYRHPYRMEFIRTSDNFKPGLKYTAFLKMSYHDDSPIREGQVSVRHAFSHNRENFKETIYRIPPNGIVPLSFYPPLDENSVSLALEAQHRELTQWLGDVSRAQSPSNSFLQATLITQDPKVGSSVRIGLNATEPLIYFVYEVLGRGNIIYAQTLQARQTTTHEFRFIATAAMAPRARLLVYYVRNDGELVADSLYFTVDGAIQNEVVVSVNPPIADAGEDVSITVTTKANSFVGLAAIDQSSLLLSRGNEITMDGIIDELETYDSSRTDETNPWNYFGHKARRSFYSWHGTATSAEVFEYAGVVVMTNGLVYNFNPYIAGFIPPGDGPVDGSNLVPGLRRAGVDGAFGRDLPPFGAVTRRPDLGPGVVYNAPTRPPLAGPYAYSYFPPPPDDKPRIYLNKALPPQWLFEDLRTRFNGVVSIREKTPDTISSYMISAFAIDDFNGLDVASLPAKLTVFRPFFVSVHFPPSVVRGEAVAVEIVVFNYGRSEAIGNVTIFNSGRGDFLFPDFVNEIDQGAPSVSRSRPVVVSPDSGEAISFMIVPQKLGSIDIKVIATAGVAVDIVTKRLIVKPEGSQLVVNNPMLVDLRREPSFSEVVNITTPRNIVPGSLEISVNVIGDVLGPAVDDLDSLIEIPTGCGEQNMAKMMPNIVLMEYLKNKNQLTEGYQVRAQRNLEMGYQRQLTFRHEDGSFSAFGKQDDKGSTWLTAFVIQGLGMARRHIDIDDRAVVEGARWLADNQEVDGSFMEKGSINNEAIQGGASKGVPLTAYIVIAFQTLKATGLQNLQNTINRALEYLVSQLETTDDPYSFAIVTYALHLAKHPLRDNSFYQLEARAIVKDDMKWWEESPLHKTIESTVDSRPLDVEMTSYALLTYSIRGLVKDSLPVLRWLTAQRNEHGGFQSTQDTAIGMEALASMAILMSHPNTRLEIQIIAGSRGDTVLVNNKNAMVLQRREVVNGTESVVINGRGSGLAVVQVTYKFNVAVTGPGPSFSLDPQLDRTTDKNKLRLTTCTGFIAGNASNMAILDVSLPTGYVIDNDLIPGLYQYPRVKKVEKKEGDTGVVLYFDSLTPLEVCPTISAYRVSKVAFQKRTPVKVYDYYDLSRQARQFYTPHAATLCDICDLGECDDTRCEKRIQELRRIQDPTDFIDPSSSVQISSSTTLLSALLLFAFWRPL